MEYYTAIKNDDVDLYSWIQAHVHYTLLSLRENTVKTGLSSVTSFV